MRRFFFLYVCLELFSCINVFSRDGDILLRINENNTSVEEFNWYYSRAYPVTKISEESFLTHFLYFKMKVEDARNRGWDTLPDFQLQCHALQRKVLESVAKSSGAEKSVLKQWLRFSQISIFLPQHVSSERELRARKTMDSIYVALRKGASFDELSHRYEAHVPFSLYQNGRWIPETCLIKEFAEQLKGLEEGAYSSPFYSPLGLHIVRMDERWQGTFPLDMKGEHESRILQSGGFTNVQNVSDSIRMQLNQVADGLLAAYWDWRHVGKAMVNVSDEELKDYFNSHKKDYAWDLPHFKGGVIHCKHKKVASRLKKILKKLPMGEWSEAIAAYSKNSPELAAEVETGLFQIGKNPYVDKLAFKCGNYVPHEDWPYSFVIGKRLRKGPENFMDVREEVLRDYRLKVEEESLADLRRKFKIEINQDILKTVNCSGKK